MREINDAMKFNGNSNIDKCVLVANVTNKMKDVVSWKLASEMRCTVVLWSQFAFLT